MVKKYAQLYLDARRTFLQQEDQQTASLLARHLLCYVSGKSHEQIVADREMYASQQVCDEMEAAVRRVMEGEPLAYVLGEWTFYGMTLYIDRNVLIPRDDTCAVAQLAIKRGKFLDENPRILDLCTGSGCIGLAVASKIKDAHVTLADVSRAALDIAKKNINRHQLGNRVTCVQADVLGPAPAFLGKFDLIISNPPYIPTGEMGELDDSVKNYEPHLALDGGDDGLDFYRSIVANYTAALKPGGYLCFEFGMGQGNDVCEILQQNGYTILDRVQDFNERERAVLAQLRRREE